MADTIKGIFPGKACSDCGEGEPLFLHDGRFVPEGKTGYFCIFCWDQRMSAEERGEPPKPLGVKPPGVPKEFENKAIKVFTRTGSVYMFGAPNEQGDRTVFCSTRNIGFDRCKILCLINGREMWLRSSDGKEIWSTSRIMSIE